MTTEKFEKINSLKNRIDSLNDMKEWDDSFIEKVKTDFTYNSNKLEGNALTFGQTIAALKDFVTPGSHASSDVLDVINHQEILDVVFDNYRTEKISVENILQLHKVLMKYIVQWEDDGHYSPGRFKMFENATMLSGGKIYRYLPPAEVPDAMEALVTAINHQLTGVDYADINRHPLTIATRFHQQFLDIHPFSDGNGRIARIFVNLILLKTGFPPIFIRDVDRKTYLHLFELSQKDILPMQEFFADKLLESLDVKLDFVLQAIQSGETAA